MLHRIILLVLGIPFSLIVNAETIEFSTDELARESVLPIFETIEVVKNRSVVKKGRFELGGSIGLNLTEALYNTVNYSVMGSYHFDESHGVNIFGLFMLSGLSQMGKDLQQGKGLIPPKKFDASLAPHPESFIFANYEFTAYYGKISLAKDFNMNLSLYGIAGLGMIGFGSTSKVGANVGLGQKFYLTNSLSLRFDLRFMMYQGPEPTSYNDLYGIPAPDASQFEESLFFHTFATVGLSWLI
ncbi:MAG: outer membrane beta-barrel domain-containing protein [Bdellovibrionales bacterium]|nr:outer membrane beta-barrel domain-containing protein [Bdellovibrionales bacterium]